MGSLKNGLSLDSYKYSGEFNGLLDELGIAENAVFIFSPYKRIVKSYTGNAVQIRRTSDYTYRDFGFDHNGDLKINEMLAWVGTGNDGLARIVYNQANPNYNAEQLTTSNEPKIISNGVFLSDGLLFDDSNDYMEVSNYSEMEIATQPLSIYSTQKVTAGTFGVVFSKSDNAFNVCFGNYVNTNTSVGMYLNNGFYGPISITQQDNVMNVYANNEVINKSGTDYKTTGYSSDVNSCDRIIVAGRVYSGGPVSNLFGGNIKTIIIFNSNEYNNYENLVTGGI
jgi:hypothetical protein